jgi:hypothetical protein
MALRRVQIPSPNYSSRGGSSVRLLVCHTAEGARTYPDLGAYFADPGVEVSSHVGIDDTPGEVGEYVARGGSAWCQSSYNGVAVCAELCAFAAWSRSEWLDNHGTMLSNLASWLAEESAALGVPLVALDAAQAQGGGAGVAQHIHLGAGGGGHVDCDYGTGNFPMGEVLEMARGGALEPLPPTPTPPAGVAPPWPGRYLQYPPLMYGEDVRTWQAQLAGRGWAIEVDSAFGEQSSEVTREFQSEALAEGHDIGAPAPDAIVGPATWALGWTKPIT